MPIKLLVIILASVIAAAAVTVAGLAMAGPAALVVALPFFALLAVAVRVWAK